MREFDDTSVGRAVRASLSATGYRNQSPGYDVRSGEGARRFGGRFNPPKSFPVLYLCTTRDCVVAELKRQAKRQGLAVDDLLPRELWTVKGDFESLLDLRSATTLESLGITAADLISDDLQLTRRIGEAAYEQRFQGLLTKSATGVDDVLVIFPENLVGTLLNCTIAERWAETADLAEGSR